MATWRQEAIKRAKRPGIYLDCLIATASISLTDYVFVEWDGGEDGGEHSVVQGKLVQLCSNASGYATGSKVNVNLVEGMYPATIIVAGNSVCMCGGRCF